MPSLSVTRPRGPTWTLLYNPPVPEALGSPLAWESIRPAFYGAFCPRVRTRRKREERWRS